MTVPTGLARPLPVVNDDNAHFWRGGASGVLQFKRCNACGALLHPPPPVCRYCRSEDIGVAGRLGPGSGGGRHRQPSAQWDPAFPAAVRHRDRRHRGGPAGPRHHQPGRCRPRRGPGRHAGARPVRGRRGRLDPAVRTRSTSPTPPSFRRTRRRPGITGAGSGPCSGRTGSRTGWRSPGSGCRPSAGGSCGRRSPLTVEAVKDAVADAGLTLDDIDGLSTYPGGGAGGGFGRGRRQRAGGRPRPAAHLVQRRRRRPSVPPGR